MPKRLGAALAALLTFAAVLAVVPLVSAEPADAHTKTIQRCSYDPFAGRQCWNESVPHTHPKPKPKTSTNYAPPPDTTPRSTTTTTEPPPTTTTTAPPKKKKQCPPGQHLNWGTTCHAHSFSTTACGTGTWRPGGHHSPVPLRPCPKPKTCPEGQTGTPPNCVPDEDDDEAEEEGDEETDDEETDDDDDPADKVCPTGKTGTPPNCVDLQTATYTVKACTPYQDATERYQRHKHPLGDSTTDGACHRADNSHCPAGQTEHGGHGSQDCRTSDATTAKLANEMRRIGGLIRTGTAASLREARAAIEAALTAYGEDAVRKAELNQHLGQEIERLYNSAPEPVQAFIEALAVGTGCAALVAIATKTIIASVGAATPAWIAAAAKGKTAAGVTCGAFYAAAKAAVSGDSGSSGDGGSSGSAQQPNAPKPDTTPESDEVTPGDLARANRDWQAGRLTDEQMEAIKARFRCQLGITSYCK